MLPSQELRELTELLVETLREKVPQEAIGGWREVCELDAVRQIRNHPWVRPNVFDQAFSEARRDYASPHRPA